MGVIAEDHSHDDDPAKNGEREADAGDEGADEVPWIVPTRSHGSSLPDQRRQVNAAIVTGRLIRRHEQVQNWAMP